MDTARINDYQISFPNRKEFFSLKREIFTQASYKIELPKNPTIIDIGSYIGLSIIFFYQNFPGATIVGYEPNSEAFQYLAENVEGLSNVEIYQEAISLKDGTVDFYTPTEDGWLSNSSMLKDSWTGQESGTRVSVNRTSFSKVLQSYAHIDLVKIDIEGYERTLFKEGVDLGNVRNILVECHPDRRGSYRKVIKNLENNNFELLYRQNGKESEHFEKDELFIVYGYRK